MKSIISEKSFGKENAFGSNFGITSERMIELNRMAISIVQKSDEFIKSMGEPDIKAYSSYMDKLVEEDRKTLSNVNEGIFYGYVLGSHITEKAFALIMEYL